MHCQYKRKIIQALKYPSLLHLKENSQLSRHVAFLVRLVADDKNTQKNTPKNTAQ